jgi:hypothetical protein
VFIASGVLRVSALSVEAPALPQQREKPVVLKAIRCFPANNPSTLIFKKVGEAVGRASQGMLKIHIKGGPEALSVRCLDIGVMSPHFGVTLFTIKGWVPEDISMGDIYRATYPFIACDLILLTVILSFPLRVLWLPKIVSN